MRKDRSKSSRPGEAKRITIIDVAERAGVSIGTVSRVVNKGAGSPETRRRVKQAIDELHYVPNHAAQSLKRQSTEQIAIVVPDIANPVYVAMAKSVQRVARERGYGLSLISTDESSIEEERALQTLERRNVDGLILCSLRPTDDLARKLEAVRSRVCVIGSLPPGIGVDNVTVDSGIGAAEAMQHLIDQSRETVAFINGTAGTVPAEARRRGYETALANRHLRLDPELCASADFTMAGGYEAAAALLRRRPELDAIFCASDVMALGALRCLAESGRRVPDDVALVGMDNIDLGRISTPTLSTVSLLAAERGRIAATLLFERTHDRRPDLEPRTVSVRPRLIVRESSSNSAPGGGSLAR